MIGDSPSRGCSDLSQSWAAGWLGKDIQHHGFELGLTRLAPVIGMNCTTVRRYARKDQTLPTHSAETVFRLAELEQFGQSDQNAPRDTFAQDRAAHFIGNPKVLGLEVLVRHFAAAK